MAKLNEKTRLLALAHLKNEKKPAEVANLLDISYASALKLNKELNEAEARNTVLDLFNVSEATFETIIESAKQELAITGELISEKEVNEKLNDLKESIQGLDLLEKNFQAAANELANQIMLLASTSQNSDTIVNLADALAKLQLSFFAKNTNVQVNNYKESSFEQYLGD